MRSFCWSTSVSSPGFCLGPQFSQTATGRVCGRVCTAHRHYRFLLRLGIRKRNERNASSFVFLFTMRRGFLLRWCVKHSRLFRRFHFVSRGTDKQVTKWTKQGMKRGRGWLFLCAFLFPARLFNLLKDQQRNGGCFFFNFSFHIFITSPFESMYGLADTTSAVTVRVTFS